MNLDKIKKLWFEISDKLRFLLVGGFNFCASYLIYTLAIMLLGEIYYQIALAISWIISSVISYTTQRIFVFQANGNILKQYFKCCLTWFFSYSINAFLLEFLVKNSINVYLAQLIAVSFSAIFTYLMFKAFAFSKK